MRNPLSFESPLLGSGIHYRIVSSSQTTISLRLVPGWLRRSDFENLPGPLTVTVINSNRGFITVLPTNSGKKDIAMIFERPKVFPDHKSIHRTHSRELHIKGTGFPETTSTFKPMLKFSPPLTEGVDYTLHVVNRTDLKVTLLEGKAWASPLQECIISLFVTAINTRGDDAGWVKFDDEGVHVALVVRDVGIEESSGSEVVRESVESTRTRSECKGISV